MNPKYKLRWARGEFRLPWVLAHTISKTKPWNPDPYDRTIH